MTSPTKYDGTCLNCGGPLDANGVCRRCLPLQGGLKAAKILIVSATLGASGIVGFAIGLFLGTWR